MKKVPGVESVKVSLNKGEALLRFRPGNAVTVGRIRQVVLDNGFTPKDADVELVGKIVESRGKPALVITGLDLIYSLADHRRARGKVNELWAKARGKQAVVRGRFPETTTKGRAEEPKILEVLTFELPS